MGHFNMGMNSPFFDNGIRKYLNRTELFNFVRETRSAPTEARLFCQVLAFAGCRITEAIALRPGHIDVGQQALIFATLKQRSVTRYRQVPIPKPLMDDLVEWVNCRPGDNGKLWNIHRQTGWRWVKNIMHKAEITGAFATPRGLRHAFAVNAVQTSMPFDKIQKWLGHENPENTAIYTNIVGPDELELAKNMWRSTELLLT